MRKIELSSDPCLPVRATNRRQARLAALMLAVCGILSGPATGAILFERCKNINAAPNFWYAPIRSSDSSVLAFDERQGVQVPDGILRVQVLNRWDDIEQLEVRPVGTSLIDSHMIYFDKVTKGKGRVTIIAEIEFDHPIVGFVADDRLFAVTNPLFAPEPTHKDAPAKARWSLEEKQSWTPLDAVTMLSPKRIRIEWTNESATDPLRVFTCRNCLAPSAMQPHPSPAKPAPLKSSPSP